MTSTALVRETPLALAAPARPALLRPIAEPKQIIEAQNEARAMVHEALKEGRDFGVVPGTDKNKPTMLKPGAERVALGFGCYYGTAEIIESEIDHDREVRWVKRKKVWNNAFHGDKTFTWAEESGVSLGLYRYVVRVPVIERSSGSVVGSGVGTCSTMESKYIDRPRDSENTALKMAYKRAMVAACLTTFGLSDEFTQDVEDLPSRDETQAPAAAAAPEEPTFDPSTMTVEQALAMPLPGAKSAWNGQGGTPIGQLNAKMIASIGKWIGKKITDAETAKESVPTINRQLARACELVLEVKGAEGEQRADPTAGSSQTQTPSDSTASKTTGSTSGTSTENSSALAPGKVEDALEKPSQLGDLTKRITTLLMNEKFDEGDRRAFRKRMENATTAEDMQKLVKDLEETIAQPF